MNTPQVKFNKNGFEIRTEVLNMAMAQMQFDYQAKFANWELSAKKNEDGSVTHTVALPDVPGVDVVLETAKKMYEFITAGQQK